MESVGDTESCVSRTEGKPENSFIKAIEQKRGTDDAPQQKSTPKERLITTEVEAHKPRTESPSIPKRAQVNPPSTLKVPVAPAEPSRIFFKDVELTPLPRVEFRATVLAAVPEEKLFTICEASPENEQMLESIGRSIEAIASKTKAGYKPKLKELVLAQYEDVFYRAVCQGITQDAQFEVRFIDYGNVSVVKENEIIKFDSDKVTKKVFVHQCVLSNLPDELTEEAVKVLSGETVPIKGAFKEDGDDAYVATLVGI